MVKNKILNLFYATGNFVKIDNIETYSTAKAFLLDEKYSDIK